MDAAVCVKELAAGYGKKNVVEDITFEVQEGEILSLIGPNGGGKSTIIKAVTGFLEKSRGEVLFFGENADKLGRAELSKILSVMLTERVKPDLMTCRDVVAAGRYPYTGMFGALSANDSEIVRNALKTVEAEELADTDFNSISDGQRQRILLARAVCQQPKILVLDEPTSFLDIRHKIVFFEILEKLVRENKLAVILSLHELDFAQKISDRIMCVKGGRITLSGSPSEVFTEENIRGLYEIPADLYKKYFWEELL